MIGRADGTCRLAYHVHYVTWLMASMAMTAGLHMRNYDGCQVWRIPTKNISQWNSVVSEVHSLNLDVWKYAPSGGWVDVLVPSDQRDYLRHRLSSNNATYMITHTNLNSTIDKERLHSYKRFRRDGSNDVIGRYAKYEEVRNSRAHTILSWMDNISRLYPAVASVVDIGNTYEGRPIRVLKVGMIRSARDNNVAARKTDLSVIMDYKIHITLHPWYQLGEPAQRKWKLWVDGGTHAREWIAISTVLYIAHKMIHGYERNDTVVHTLLKRLDWYFLPVVNPDGYEYTHTTDRLWRKNRQAFNYSGCHGIDLNRNCNYKWGGASSSANPCSSVYRGNSPEEALEVKSVVNFLLPRSEAFLGFVTYHSYGQNFVSRWDYSKHIIPRDHMQLMALAEKATRKMQRVNGVSYKVGRGPEILYPYGGGSADWAKGVAGIKYSYLVELRDEYSFILPAREIRTTGDENWAAVRLIGREIINAYKHKMAPLNVPDHVTSRDQEHKDDNSKIFTGHGETQGSSSSGSSKTVIGKLFIVMFWVVLNICTYVLL